MRHVIWSRAARRDVAAIHAYVARDSPEAASRLLRRFETVAEGLTDFPFKGRSIRRGLRQILAAFPYVIRYRVTHDLIEITRVYHGARNVRSPRLPYAAEQPMPAA